jgi:hypothetical protein
MRCLQCKGENVSKYSEKLHHILCEDCGWGLTYSNLDLDSNLFLLNYLIQEAMIEGRKAYVLGIKLEENPHTWEKEAQEHASWAKGWNIEKEHFKDLGDISFPRKKTEEQKSQIQKEHTKTLLDQEHDNYITLQARLSKIEEFIVKLRNSPKEWARTYRILIDKFCSRMEL